MSIATANGMINSVDSDSEHSIVLLSSFDELERVRDFCCEVLQHSPESEDYERKLAAIQLATVEAVTNVIRHGYELAEANEIECHASVTEGNLTLEIRHEGKPFHPTAVPDLDEPQEGGMGLFLIDQCVDESTYLQLPDGRQCIRLELCLDS